MSQSNRKQKGLLDTVLAMALLYGVYSHTPIGAIAETGYRIFTGQKHRPSLFATFKGRETEVNIDGNFPATGIRGHPLSSLIIRTAKKYKIDPYLLSSLVQTHGSCGDTDCTVAPPPYISEIIKDTSDKPTMTVELIARAIYKAGSRLGYGSEQAVEVLYCGTKNVQRAIQKARISGLKEYRETAVHAAMYPPGIRRGDLQNALAVLARYRVTTLQWPMELDRKITSPFGLRIDPINHKKSRHTGIDISAPVNHPVSSVHRGYIQHISRDSVSGIWLRVNHGFGIFSTFCHLNSINVRKSDWVRQKQVVAKSGNTGRSTGPHLHYSLMINNGLVNPMKYGFSPRNIRR